jgi:hypothetical protein
VKKLKIVRSVLLLLALQTPAAVAQAIGGTAAGTAAPVRKVEQNVQAWLGGVSTDDGWSSRDPTDGEPLTGDIGTLPYLGGAGQKLWGGSIQTGFEGGGLATWKNDATDFFATNNTLRISVDNTLFSFEFFFGAVLSLRPVPWLRVYAATGPSLAYAHLDDDNAEPAPDPLSSTSIEFGSGGDSLSLALYGRAGFEFETREGFTFGAHARYADHEFDFDDSGKLKLDNVQYFVTFGQRL